MRSRHSPMTVYLNYPSVRALESVHVKILPVRLLCLNVGLKELGFGVEIGNNISCTEMPVFGCMSSRLKLNEI